MTTRWGTRSQARRRCRQSCHRAGRRRSAPASACRTSTSRAWKSRMPTVCCSSATAGSPGCTRMASAPPTGPPSPPRAAVFGGISEAAFRRQYWPVCRTIANDNMLGKLTFRLTKRVQQSRGLRRAILRAVQAEQHKPGEDRPLSGILWDLFSGSAPYRQIFGRMLHPELLWRLVRSTVASGLPGNGPGLAQEGS